MDENLVYCTDVMDWWLFVDSSRRSLKCVLLHNENQYAFSALSPINYDKRKVWENKGSFGKKILLRAQLDNLSGFKYGQQSGYTKYQCFICLWDTREIKPL